MIIEIIRGLGLGGAENLLFKRVEYWIKNDIIDVKGIKILNTAPDFNFYGESFEKLGVEVIESRSSRVLDGYQAVSTSLKELGPGDSVVFHSPLPSYLAKAQRVVKRKNVPLILEVAHNTTYRSIYMAMGALLDRFADHVIWVSEDVQKSRVGRGFQKGTLLTGGVDRESMRGWVTQNPLAWMEYRHKIGLDENDRLIVAVAGLRPEKRHVALVESLVSPDLDNFHLAIIGEGPERSSIEARVHDLGLEDRVHLLGSQADGWKWTAVADAIGQPSSHEGLPVSLMEAAALGTPIAATDVGGIKDILESTASGEIIADQSIVGISRALSNILSEAGHIQEVFPDRATHPVRWDLGTFALQFFNLIENQSIVSTDR